MIGTEKNILSKYLNNILNLNYKFKILFLFLIDIFFLLSSLFCAYFLKFDNFDIYKLDKIIFLENLIIFVLVAFTSKFYSNYTRYIDFETIIKLLSKLLIFSFLLLFFSMIIFNQPEYSQKLILIQLIFFINFIFISRVFIYFLLRFFDQNNSKMKFYYLGPEIKFNEFALNFFLNNKSFQGFILKKFEDKRSILSKKKILLTNFLKSSNKIDHKNTYFIYSNNNESVKIKNSLSKKKFLSENNFITVPQLKDFISGKYQLKKYKEINLENLLSRQINFNKNMISKFILNKSILITGAGGSIGSEIANQLSSYKPKMLVFFDHSEYNTFKLQELITKKYPNLKCKYIIGSVNSKLDLELLFKRYSFDLVYHAAAYKHVPLLEKENLLKSITNNILGTHNLLLMLTKHKVKNFLFISTDKAVRSKNIMGLTKRIGELLVQSYAINFNLNFNIVRFGNVVGSSGSAVNIFYDQIKKNQNITLTHKDATRYFMLVKEAVGLVLEASAYSSKGHIYLLDMGNPIKIYDLIIKMINLAGLKIKDKNNIEGDIAIKIIGLRPGEKLYEELLVDPKSFEQISNYIYRANDPTLNFKSSQNLIRLINKNIKVDNQKNLKKILQSFSYDNFSQHIKL